ncbi:DNA-binding transcriptional MerR regulator [Mumia flava]|uniref:DNA-binding transcriptional MerR regulator n=1 Tax=Mumia flava TaxID=1348852 RepID=A0A2M9AQ76_9ACTN|nr:MerR family transcriptional regulator [Mumia flava]PJJ47855.1 DNA-binding transcriptional MerR regulator [Mumia flava]
MLTISQLASYAGVTVRAVRHYHAKGLLQEPDRDHSGYRRYDAAAVVDLIRIRTLAGAGVPLSRVKELLDADDEEFAAAVADIDRRLRAEIRERQRHRTQIAQLAAGESLALPPEVVAYLDRLRALGIPEKMVVGERDAWILVAAQLPDQMATMMALKSAQLDEPMVVDLYRDLSEAIEWSPDDPRLPVLVDTLVTSISSSDQSWDDHEEEFAFSDELVDLLDTVFLESVPIAPRVLELLEERGWTGWTKLERIAPDPATTEQVTRPSRAASS